jgi:transposase
MIGTTRIIQVFAFPKPIDMRKWFDGLFGLVTQSLHRNPLSGELFLFVSKNRKRAKVLYWDGTGLCIFAKRLEKGHFARLWRDDVSVPLSLTQSELALFLEGSDLAGKLPLSPGPFTLGG